jgi:hypothetical protein
MQGLLINNNIYSSGNYAEWIKYNYDNIILLVQEQFKKEDLYNKAYVNRNLMQYYLAFYLIWLVAEEYFNSSNKDWEYYKTKYDLIVKKKKLGCHNIELEYLLALFNLPSLVSNPSGITGGIEGDFGIPGHGQGIG